VSLVIKSIEFSNFRNYQRLELDLPARLTIIKGDNAAGKTNIIEGIQLMTMLSSFRNPVWEETILNKSKKCCLRIHFEINNRDIDLILEIYDNKRAYFLNGKRKQPNTIQGILPSVLFTPEDLNIVKGSAEMRRSSIDTLGTQLSKTYAAIRLDYLKVLKQRNALLRERFIDKDLIESWNQNLAHLGALYLLNRTKLFKRLMENTTKIYPALSPEERFSYRYIPSYQSESNEGEYSNPDKLSKTEIECILLSTLEARKNEEYVRRKSLIGPHRDDIRYYINGRDARTFGSQGQQRTIVLALKIAEIQIIRQITKTEPILLLDDVMSELDESRRNALLSTVTTKNYTFITTTNLGYFNDETLKQAQILDLSKNNQPIVKADLKGDS